MPPSVKAAAEEKARLDAIHQRHLAEIRPAVDTSPPPTYSHLGPGSGKAATLAAGAASRVVRGVKSACPNQGWPLTASDFVTTARQQDIDAGNARLLNDLTRIAAGGSSIDHGQGPKKATPLTAGRTLNSVGAQAKQVRIDADNRRLLGKLTLIAQSGGAYDSQRLEKDHAAHLSHLARISRFPPPK